MHYLPYVIFAALAVGLLGFSSRARRKQASAQAQRSDQIGVGSEVMTTSGLYGTVVGRNPDDTVLLSIAPGVEVKWALAALRDVDSLPRQYRQQASAQEEAQPDPGGVDLGKPRRLDGPEPA